MQFRKKYLVLAMCACINANIYAETPATKSPTDGSVLPFPRTPTASNAKMMAQDSTMKWRTSESHLPKDAPNIVIILLDDVGFGQLSTYGGPVNSPTLSKIADTGISYNRFQTTALSSPTRASLLTGRNHHRVGNGVIAEMASDFDGYTGVIPTSAATLPKVLKDYGYVSAAFGKWHNTPALETTDMGPFNRWPTGSEVGFDYFYGFLGGETSQWEPRLVENFNTVEPPHNDPTYHLSSDLANKSVSWLRKRKSYAPDKPFFLYYAPGAGHGPHQVAKEWADKYKGKFSGGWDKLREDVFAKQKAMGWIPADAKLTPRPANIPAWDSIPDSEKPFQERLMELYAGFVEQADVETGKIIDELDRQGIRDNTLIFYVTGDNGAATAGGDGTISELLFQNGMKTTIAEQIEALNKIGGMDVLGSNKTDNMYHRGWGWAGNTPFQYYKQVASHLGGTRNPLAVSWPSKIKPDNVVRSQFTYVTDIVPTIYDVLGINAPKVVDGIEQDSIDGVSFKETFDNPKAETKHNTQYFEMFANLGIYNKEWMASALAPNNRTDLMTMEQKKNWNPNDNSIWELYDLSKDYSQANNVAAQYPEKVESMKKLFLEEAGANDVFPIGASFWFRLHPKDRLSSPYKNWTFDESTRRMPEFAAPGLGRESNSVVVNLDVPKNAKGVIYALGGFSGGLSLFMDNGKLYYEYNSMMINRYNNQPKDVITAGNHTFDIETTIEKPGLPGTIVIKVDGKEYSRLEVPVTVPQAFTATETFDVGVDLGSVVSPVYFERAPFKFNGKINEVKVDLK